MKFVLKLTIHLLIVMGFCVIGFTQQNQEFLINRMRQYEQNILNMYLEYQKLYYEDKSQKHELLGFEDLLTVYIKQVTEIYETLSLSNQKVQEPRDIAARALIFKALMYLEKAPLNVEYYEKACYEYYEALNLYDSTEEPPVIFKELPKMIQAGDKTYFRLIDLLDDKGRGLHAFGKVLVSFRNFRVTANFNPQMLELIKVEDGESASRDYTYLLSEDRLKRAFDEVFQKSRDIQTYMALPHGTYVLRLRSLHKADYTPLTRFYVRANQVQEHIMEPLADWLILYENPTSKRPDFYKFKRTNQNVNSVATSNGFSMQTSGNGSEGKSTEYAEAGLSGSHEALVEEIVSYYLPQFEIKLIFDLNDPEMKQNSIEIISKAIVAHVESQSFYNEWNQWSTSWEIAKNVREIISPGSLLPLELVQLIYHVINEL
ncbi:MAG: hypothetical protein ACE5IR_06255 [bacterium]